MNSIICVVQENNLTQIITLCEFLYTIFHFKYITNLIIEKKACNGLVSIIELSSNFSDDSK